MTCLPSISCRNPGSKLFYSKTVFLGAVVLPSLYAAAAGTEIPTYTRDLMPIIQDSCQLCHRPERIAPMSFMSYEEVRPWAKAIRKVVANRTMPPFHAETSLGPLENDSRLTTEQIATVVRWVDGGAQRGDPADAPPVKEWGDSKWELAEPDLIINYPEFKLSLDGENEYVMFSSDHTFARDTWVEAIEFRGSDYVSVHHAGVYAVDGEFPVSDSGLMVIPPDEPSEVRKGLRFGSDRTTLLLGGQHFLFTWAPGFGIHHLSPGEGILIRQGESMVVQAHLGPREESRLVSMSLALDFVNGLITKSSHKLGPAVRDLEIPAGDPHYELRRRMVVKEPIQVYASWTHMHLRGKSNKFLFHYPDGRVETAFDIPRYNFDWQRPYFLKEAVTVPKGTTVEYIGVFDNSSDNPFNPDPSQTVTYGGSTNDEMYGVLLYYSKNLDTPFEVVNGISDAAFVPPKTSPELKPTAGRRGKFQILVTRVEGMSLEELKDFVEPLNPEQADSVRKIWERKHGPLP